MMCADQLRFGEHAKQLEDVGVHLWHMDIMDGRFAPNVSMGLPQLEQFHSQTALPYDVHLMVEDNDLLVGLVAPYCGPGSQIAVHAESSTHLDRTLSLIRDHGIKAGVAINPHTHPQVLRYVLDRIDFVCVMTVNPGFAGQKLVPSGIRKIADTRAFLDNLGCDIPIEVDGNVSFDHIPDMVAAGADILVAGTSSIFNKSGTLEENVTRINEAVARGYAQRMTQRGEGTLV